MRSLRGKRLTSILCCIYVTSLLLGSSHQHRLFKMYLLTKLVLKKGPRLLPVPIPIKIPQEPKIIKVPVVQTSQHVHIHYHGKPPHPCEILTPKQHHGGGVHNELVREGFSTLNHIDDGYRRKDIDRRFGHPTNWTPRHPPRRIRHHSNSWPPLPRSSPESREILRWRQL